MTDTKRQNTVGVRLATPIIDGFYLAVGIAIGTLFVIATPLGWAIVAVITFISSHAQ